MRAIPNLRYERIWRELGSELRGCEPTQPPPHPRATILSEDARATYLLVIGTVALAAERRTGRARWSRVLGGGPPRLG